jgi:hypothetical protein
MEWYWQGKSEVLEANPVPVKLPPPQISDGMVWSSGLWHPSNLVSGYQQCQEIYYVHHQSRAHANTLQTTTVLLNLRLSLQRSWRFRSSWIWCRLGGYTVTDVSNELDASIFRVATEKLPWRCSHQAPQNDGHYLMVHCRRRLNLHYHNSNVHWTIWQATMYAIRKQCYTSPQHTRSTAATLMTLEKQWILNLVHIIKKSVWVYLSVLKQR